MMAAPSASFLSAQPLRDFADTIDDWDNDPDFAGLDGFQDPRSVPRVDLGSLRRRESVSSRMSITSGFDTDAMTDAGDNEHEHQQLPLDDSPSAAIRSAITAGIPIPENVPPSALVGGTIKRLGTRKRARKSIAHDDWSEDLMLPSSGPLSVKKREFPQTLHHIPSEEVLTIGRSTDVGGALNRFRDSPEDYDFFSSSDELSFKPPSRNRSRPPLSNVLLTPPPSEPPVKASPSPITSADDEFEHDFEFPADGPITLNLRKAPSKPASIANSDLDAWGDTESISGHSQNGNSRRSAETSNLSKPPSSITSPSISSVPESDDEPPLEGLVLPEGGMPDFKAILDRKKSIQLSPSEDDSFFEFKGPSMEPGRDEFLEGLEIGNGEIFDSKKVTLNRNIKHKPLNRKTSPIRRSTTLTFTSKDAGIVKSLQRSQTAPRLSGQPTLLPPISVLEPVAERENLSPQKRPENRRQRSVGYTGDTLWANRPADIPRSSPMPQSPPRSPNRTSSMRHENRPTTTAAQFLRAKRSMQNMGSQNSGRPSSQNSTGRPSSRTSTGRVSAAGSRPPSTGGRPSSRASIGRPPSSNDSLSGRTRTPHSSNTGTLRHKPFLPAGTSNSQHVSAKTSRPTSAAARPNSTVARPTSRAQQRTPRPPTTSPKVVRKTPTVAPERLRQEALQQGTLTQPTRKRNYGDGTELENFDDLPTSARVEGRYTVTPAGQGAPRHAHSRSLPNKRALDYESPKKKQDTKTVREVPSFARDTTASRNAREETMAKLGMASAVPRSSTPVAQWRNQIASRSTSSARKPKKPQQRPHLIKPLGSSGSIAKAASSNGMTFNPKTHRWEGNESDLRLFEMPESPPVVAATRTPALITNVNQSGPKLGVQVVGGMVFDPAKMCWLKIDEDPDDADPFAGLDDLEDPDLMSLDERSNSGVIGGNDSILLGAMSNQGSGRLSNSGAGGEFVVGEEFDVGPEFMRRQREEEQRWRQTVDGWVDSTVAAQNRNELRELLKAYNA